MPPTVDVNLFVFNNVETVARAVESVLNQTWPAICLSVTDDGSTDGSAELLETLARKDRRIHLTRRRHNIGAVASFQHSFRTGNSDFVMPKSGDDLLAPDFIERVMEVLLAHPGCAMCHAAGLVFKGEDTVLFRYPPGHNLAAIGGDPITRAVTVMRSYTSSPAFWGVYRRTATDRLSPIPYRAGWDHALLAELALFGEIRHVPQVLYWRRDGGKPVSYLARAATPQARAGHPAEDPLGDARWRTPLITTAFAHIEVFATTRLPLAERRAAIAEVAPCFRDRWLPSLRREASRLSADAPALIAEIGAAGHEEARLAAANLLCALHASEAIVPEIDQTTHRLELNLLQPRGHG